VKGAGFCSQYLADAPISRQEFRVFMDYSADFCRRKNMTNDVSPEPRDLLFMESSNFLVTEYSDWASHGISLLGILLASDHEEMRGIYEPILENIDVPSSPAATSCSDWLLDSELASAIARYILSISHDVATPKALRPGLGIHGHPPS
jgi:hypothetical protein